MIGYFLVLGNRRGFCYGSSVQYGEEHVSIRPTFTAYLPDLSHFIIFIGRREQSSAEVERSSLSLSLLVFSLLVVILQFQIETAKCDGPESWAVGWVLYDRLGLREAEQIQINCGS